MTSNITTMINCPTCQKPQVWDPENRYRPFCSQRCRLIDLGEWASENHRIAGDPLTADLLSDDLDAY